MRALLAVLVVLACAAPAAASPAWLPAEAPYTEAPAPGQAQGVMLPDGTVVMIAIAAPDGTLTARTRPPGGTFGAPQTIATDAAFARLAVGPDGTVGLSYRADFKLWAAARRPGEGFDTPTALVDSGGTPEDIAVEDGRVWVAYQTPSATGTSVAVRALDGGVLTRVVSAGMSPALARRAGGGVTVLSKTQVVTDGAGNDCSIATTIQGIDVAPDGTLSSSETLASATAPATHPGGNPICDPTGGKQVYSPAAATGEDGEQTFTYLEISYGPSTTAAKARVRAAGAELPATGPEEDLGAGYGLDIAYAAGTPLALITRSNGLVARQRIGGAWGEPEVLSAATVADGAVVTGSVAGTAAVVFRAGGGVVAAPVMGAVRQADGTFTNPVPVSDTTGPAFPPTAGVDSAGNAVAVWVRDTDPSGATAYRPEVAGYDGAGPRVEITLPPLPVAGGPLGFSAAVNDVWSAVGDIAWAFGDGGTAVGAAPSHTFASPGSVKVTATATDAVGNAGSASRDLVVGAAPDQTPGPDTTPPALSEVRVKVRKRRARISFVLSEAATVRARVRRGKRTVARRTATLAAGKHTLKTRRLRKRRFRLVLRATDAAGNAAAPPRARFRVR